MNRFSTFFRSLRRALRGVGEVFRTEHNFRLQSCAAVLALTAAVIFRIALWQAMLVVLLCVAVLVLEIVNSIIERLADAVHPRMSTMVRDVKDMTAGAVLLTSIAAAGVGIMIFFPYFAPYVVLIVAWGKFMLY